MRCKGIRDQKVVQLYHLNDKISDIKVKIALKSTVYVACILIYIGYISNLPSFVIFHRKLRPGFIFYRYIRRKIIGTMIDNQIDKDFVIPNNIKSYFNTAEKVYAFMTGVLTDLQSRYIFKKILEDAYEIANMYPTNEAVGFLLEIINNLPNCIKTEDKNRLIESLNFQGVQICVKTGDEIQFTHKSLTQRQKQLPPIEHLVQGFNLFDKNVYKDEFYYPNLELWKKLSKHIKDDDISAFLKQPVPDFERNCFYLMEFMIGYQKWNNEYVKDENDDELTDNDKLYFRWYCLGEIMDIILDIIYTSPQLDLSKSLYASLFKECDKQPELRKVVKERYEIISKIRLYPDNFIFYNDEIEKEIPQPKGQLKGFGPIKIEINNNNIPTYKIVEEEKINLLFSNLVIKEILDAKDKEAFKAIVSDDYIIEPIIWKGNSKRLTAFIDVAYYNKGIDNKEKQRNSRMYHARLGAKLFLKKDGSYYSVSACKVTDDISNEIKEMKEIFNIAGIKR